MARNVFLSILGTSYYHPVHYYFNNEKSTAIETRFAQEATIKHYCENWGDDDKIYIFLTRKAYETNWQNPAQKLNAQSRETYQGLGMRLEELEIIETVFIPDGNTTEEIWHIFEIIYKKLQPSDKVYADITHAFRYLPMLLMVLVNYARFLKNIEVEMISYGNWEAREKIHNKILAPVLDLTPLSDLQEWTNSVNIYKSSGDVRSITTLAQNDLTPFLKQYKGKNESANAMRIFLKTLPEFIDNIKTCRGKNIVTNSPGYTLNQTIDNISENFIPPLQPILNTFKDDFKNFHKENDVRNGFFAVEHCLKNNLLQQAATILKETVTSLLCNEQKIDYTIKDNRELMDSCMNAYINNDVHNKETWNFLIRENETTAKNIWKNSAYIPKLHMEVANLNAIRNDINHAGFREAPISAGKLKDAISKIYNTIISLVYPK